MIFAVFPLSAGQIRNMRKMRITQPLMKERQTEIQQRYKNDPQKQQEEMGKLMQELGNPLAGCLPLLLQMPILLALFATLRGSPFSDINYTVDLQVLPAEQIALVQRQPYGTKPQNVSIDEYIITAFPAIIEPEKLRLTFNQKLELINNDKTVFGMAYSAIKSLNTLRNKFSHKLSYKTVDSDYKEIKDLMTIWNNALGEQTPTGLILIQEFSVWICGNLDSMTRGIKRETPELGLSGYLTFLHKMTSV